MHFEISSICYTWDDPIITLRSSIDSAAPVCTNHGSIDPPNAAGTFEGFVILPVVTPWKKGLHFRSLLKFGLPRISDVLDEVMRRGFLLLGGYQMELKCFDVYQEAQVDWERVLGHA